MTRPAPTPHRPTSHARDDDAQASLRPQLLTRIVLRPLATPLPLGVLALAFGSILLTALQLQWIAPMTTPQVASVILVLVVPLELLAAVVAFAIRDVVMATGLGVLTGTWAATGLLMLTGKPGVLSPVLGIVAIAVGAALLVPAASAAPAKPAAAILFSVAATRFALTAVFQLGGGAYWATASGIVGLVMVAAALYSSFAFALEDARHHQVLPMSRRSTSASALSGDLDAQLQNLPTEAGIRQES